MKQRTWFQLTVLVVMALALVMVNVGEGGAPALDQRAKVGLTISPLPMNLNGANKEQVGLGSYLLNSAGNCNDCHSAQWFAAGGNPFLGQPEQIDQATYLTGGRSFGPTISRNLRPEIGTGLPAGLTSEQFLNAMTVGTDYDNPGQLLQVMPWPYYHDMTDQDINAIYAYLSTLSAVPPGG
jgi:mono/diheme cytochrome c family protein